tara:strand:- start:19173 stop:19766 length:594 start_codon:yes stop_codon:yes gene_type:complete
MIDEKKIHTTPVGVANYPYIFTADTQFEKAGVFSVKLILSDSEAKPFVKVYEETLKARQQKENTDKRSAHNQYKVLKDGGIEFKFKLKQKVTMRDGTDFEQRPKILNADKTVAEEQPVYSGSKMKIAFQAVSWHNNLQGVGVSLRLKAVQLIEVVSEKPKSNGDKKSSDYDYGFGEEKVSNVPSGKKEAPVSQEADF